MDTLHFALFGALVMGGCGGGDFTAGSGGNAGGVAGSSSGSASTGGAMVSGGAGAGGAVIISGGAGAGGSPTAGAAGPAHACDRSTWTGSAFMNERDDACGPQNTCEVGGPPAAAFDGSDNTRWSSGIPQAAGQWFSVSLSSPAVLKSLRLTSPIPNQLDLPNTLTLELDGHVIDFSTSTTVTGVLELQFPATLTSSFRFTLQQASPTAAWWSMNELDGMCQ